MVLSDLTTAVLNKTHRTDKTTRIQELVKQVLIDVSAMVDEYGNPIKFDCLKDTEEFSLSTGDYRKALPADFVYEHGKPEFRYDTDKGYAMSKCSLTDLRYIYPNLENFTGGRTKPYHYAIDAGYFWFGDQSDGSYIILFPHTIRHAEVTSDSDIIRYPDHFLLPLRDVVIAELFDDLERYEEAAKFRSEGMNKLKALATLDIRNTSGARITRYSDI